VGPSWTPIHNLVEGERKEVGCHPHATRNPDRVQDHAVERTALLNVLGEVKGLHQAHRDAAKAEPY
jgi:hypothetical protein